MCQRLKCSWLRLRIGPSNFCFVANAKSAQQLCDTFIYSPINRMRYKRVDKRCIRTAVASESCARLPFAKRFKVRNQRRIESNAMFIHLFEKKYVTNPSEIVPHFAISQYRSFLSTERKRNTKERLFSTFGGNSKKCEFLGMQFDRKSVYFIWWKRVLLKLLWALSLLASFPV